jgi:hypothetical protein
MDSNPTGGMDVCLLSGRGLCNELITRLEGSYRLWCIVLIKKPWEQGGHGLCWAAVPVKQSINQFHTHKNNSQWYHHSDVVYCQKALILLTKASPQISFLIYYSSTVLKCHFLDTSSACWNVLQCVYSLTLSVRGLSRRPSWRSTSTPRCSHAC